MKYEIVELEEKLVEGIGIKASNTSEGTASIGALWQAFFTKGNYEKIANKVNAKTIGLYCEYEGDYTKPYQFVTGAQVSKPSEVLESRITKVIKKGKYAKFVVAGENFQQEVAKVWKEIWAMPLERIYTTDFEEYQNNTPDPLKQEVHIYIAIK